jgi:hypothetical protein
MRGVKLNLTGKRFGKLIVLGEIPERRKGYVCWLVQCDCGSPQKVYSTAALTSRSIKPTRSCGCLWKKPLGESAKHRVWLTYKRNAKKSNRLWELTIDQFTTLTQNTCYYCGRLPSGICGGKDINGPYIYNGIDRINNDQGYTSGNVLSCCKICNWAKGKMAYSDFMSYIQQLTNYHNEKGTFTPITRNQAKAAVSR